MKPPALELVPAAAPPELTEGQRRLARAVARALLKAALRDLEAEAKHHALRAPDPIADQGDRR